jgi:hypothetical protein
MPLIPNLGVFTSANTPYWAVQEGLVGDVFNKLSTFPGGSQALDVTWTVVRQASKPNASAHGPYPTQAAAAAEAASLNQTAAGSVVAQAANAKGNPINSVTNFLKDLSSRNTLLRLAEGTLGIALIIVGVAKLADGTAVGAALKKVPFV